MNENPFQDCIGGRHTSQQKQSSKAQVWACSSQRDFSKLLSTLEFHWIPWFLLTFPLWIKDDVSDVLKLKDHHFSINFLNSQWLLSLVPNIRQYIFIDIAAMILETSSHESSHIIASIFSYKILLSFSSVNIFGFFITRFRENRISFGVTPECSRPALLTPCSEADQWPMTSLRDITGRRNHKGLP